MLFSTDLCGLLQNVSTKKKTAMLCQDLSVSDSPMHLYLSIENSKRAKISIREKLQKRAEKPTSLAQTKHHQSINSSLTI